MADKKGVQIRREKINQLLIKSVTSPTEIARILGISYDTVQNDIKWLRSQTRPWLSGLALDGFAFDVKIAIERLGGIEKQLEEMREEARKNKASTYEQIAILRELRDTTIVKINAEGEGPVLVTLRKVIRGDFKIEEESSEHKDNGAK